VIVEGEAKGKIEEAEEAGALELGVEETGDFVELEGSEHGHEAAAEEAEGEDGDKAGGHAEGMAGNVEPR
jgi:hypothetical protein